MISDDDGFLTAGRLSYTTCKQSEMRFALILIEDDAPAHGGQQTRWSKEDIYSGIKWICDRQAEDTNCEEQQVSRSAHQLFQPKHMALLMLPHVCIC